MEINEQRYEELRQLYITNIKKIEKKLKMSKIRNIATITVFLAAVLCLSAKNYTIKEELELSKNKWEEILPYLSSITDNLYLYEQLKKNQLAEITEKITKDDLEYVIKNTHFDESTGGGE